MSFLKSDEVLLEDHLKNYYSIVRDVITHTRLCEGGMEHLSI